MISLKISDLKIRFSVLFCLFAVLFLSGGGFVAVGASSRLYVEAPAAISAGSEFEADVFIDSDVPLNAYNVALLYSPDVFLAEEVNNSNSIIDVWQNQPNVSKPGEIEIVGGSFRGFAETRGKLLTIRFKALKESEGIFSFRTAEVYMANGKGTKADLIRENARISISEGVPIPIAEKEDANPPEISFLALEEDPLNPSQQLLSFLVTDDSSGVRGAMARYRTWIFWSEWVPVENPTAIPSNAWAVGFRVADNSENQVAQVVYYWPVFMKNFFPIGFVLLGLVFFLLYRFGVLQRRS